MATFAPEKVKLSRRPSLRIILVGLGVAVAVILSGLWFWWSSGASTKGVIAPVATVNADNNAPTGNLSQTSEGGQVTVTATRQFKESSPTFTIALNTHSVGLDGYDLSQLALLRTDQGREVQPSSWDAPKGGHHRQGTLTFPAATIDGRPVIETSTRSIELLIRGVGGVPERVLRWTF